MIRLLCVGKLKEEYLKSLVMDYNKRINKYHSLEIVEVKDEDSLLKERDSLKKHFKNNEFRIALCIEGQSFDSVTFAKMLDESFIKYPCITFVIGSSLGLHDEIKNAFTTDGSTSDLLEQIYRGFKINNNETYHK